MKNLNSAIIWILLGGIIGYIISQQIGALIGGIIGYFIGDKLK